MSTDLTLKIVCNNSSATEKLGRAVGRNLRGGESIELTSDLGGGKTTLTRGLVAGTGSDDIVSSPTFTVHKQYKAPKFNIEHFDFYRLQDPGLVANELAENIDDPSAVTIVEWADSVQDVLPSKRLHTQIKAVAGDSDERVIELQVPPELKYLLKGVK